MDNKMRSLLAGLSDYTPARAGDRDLFIESRAMAVIASVSHLLKLIEENYDDETAADLTKRLFNAARSSDEEKFRRKIRAIRESRRRGKQV